MNAKDRIFLIGIGLLLLCVFIGTVSAKTWYVDDDGGADFTKIRDAVNAAGAGDTIIVRDGWYYETLEVNKSLTIRSENGSEKTHIRFGGFYEERFSPLINITADFVNISGFEFGSTPECYNPAIHCRGNYVNISNNKIFSSEGIYLGNSQHCTIEDNEIDTGGVGISLESSHHNMITNNIINDWFRLELSSSSMIIGNTGAGAIHLDRSDNNNISRNFLDIYLEYSNTYNTIIENSFNFLSIRGSHYNDIIRNNVSKDGIDVRSSIWNNIIGNVFLNGSEGLFLYDSNDNYVINNSFENSGIFIDGYSIEDFNRYTIEGNTVNGRSIYYYKNIGGIKIPEDAGEVILANCTDMTVEDINASFGSIGIELAYTDDSEITNNIVSNNKRYGIYLVYSYDNNITNNDISNNIYGLNFDGGYRNKIAGNNVNSNDYGIYLWYSSDNLVYNNYFNNTNNVIDQNINMWNISKTEGANIVGGPYLGGNYWSDYMGKDTDGDGLGNTLLPYTSTANIRYGGDYLPLIRATIIPVFDTGKPINSYPSIFGTHTGKIKPNHDVIVNRMYTYACIGTGGHTEYVRFENESWNVTANWNGYKGDWHNITFNETFTLQAGLEYNYTIRTGSYPQIHHNRTLIVSDGEIMCTKFTDANGRVYYDWIPAIKLFL